MKYYLIADTAPHIENNKENAFTRRYNLYSVFIYTEDQLYFVPKNPNATIQHIKYTIEFGDKQYMHSTASKANNFTELSYTTLVEWLNRPNYIFTDTAKKICGEIYPEAFI